MIRCGREGRLTYRSGRGARSLVVRYAVTDDQILFLIPAYNEITQYVPGARVTFAIDELDPTVVPQRWGRVKIRGTAYLIGPEQQESSALETDFSESWPQGVKTSIISLPISEVDGSKDELRRVMT